MVAVGGPWAGLTAARVAPRIWPECSCSGQAPSSCRPPRCAAPRSPSPGSRRGWRSGSPSAAGHPATSWLPDCSSGAAPSTGRPVREKGRRGQQLDRLQLIILISLFRAVLDEKVSVVTVVTPQTHLKQLRVTLSSLKQHLESIQTTVLFIPALKKNFIGGKLSTFSEPLVSALHPILTTIIMNHFFSKMVKKRIIPINSLYTFVIFWLFNILTFYCYTVM